MSAVSTVSQIKQVLLDRMTQTGDLTDWTLAWAFPGDLPRESIYFAGAVSTIDVNVIGNDRTFDDSIVVTLVINGNVPGRSAEEATKASDEAFSIVRGLLLDAVQVETGSADNTFGTADVTSLNATSGLSPDLEGWVGAVVVSITYEVLLDN